jgi:hypothetical protein
MGWMLPGQSEGTTAMPAPTTVIRSEQLQMSILPRPASGEPSAIVQTQQVGFIVVIGAYEHCIAPGTSVIRAAQEIRTALVS